jgi:hypothetical protein
MRIGSFCGQNRSCKKQIKASPTDRLVQESKATVTRQAKDEEERGFSFHCCSKKTWLKISTIFPTQAGQAP